MKNHQGIDERSLAMARAIVARIDADPNKQGLQQARATCRRWLQQSPLPVLHEWLNILDQPWEQVRQVVLDDSEQGTRLRQSSPFCGILTPRERWSIYRQFREKS